MFALLMLLFCVVHVLSGPAITLNRCSPGDNDCVTKAVQAAYPFVIYPNADIGAEELDPMFHKVIEGNLSILKFKLFNTTVTGFRECQVQKASYDVAEDKVQINLHCPYFNLDGQYDINGRLIILPVEGKGDYLLYTKKFDLTVDLDLNDVEHDGKKYKHIKGFRFKAVPLEPVTYDFKNLFNGQKDLAEAVLKFANENWKEVAFEVQDPVFTANFKKIVKNANKYLKTLPIDEYIA